MYSLRSFLWPANAGRITALLIAGMTPIPLAAEDSSTTKETPPAASDPEAPDHEAMAHFLKVVSPILEDRCYDCHGDGAKKGGLALDALTTREQILQDPQLWLKILRNTRSHVMPPPDKSPLTAAEQLALEQWIKRSGFGLDPARPDPGRVTIRRLNRAEYRNTLRDLIGVDFDADAMLPPDDVGYGFDNIGDVLSISPMRMEKFIEASIAAVNQGVPLDTVALSERKTLGGEFLTEDGSRNAERMSFYRAQKSTHRYRITATGDYRIVLHTKIDGEARPIDPQQAKVIWTCDGKELLNETYKWADAEFLTNEFTAHWEPGDHDLSVSIEPVFPELEPLRTKMEYRLLWVDLVGPLAKEQWEHHPNYQRFYTRDRPPADPAERRAYAREVLARFVPKAYRRPVAPETINQLVNIAEKAYSLPDTTFEKGIAQAIIAVLASPRFLFHIETAEPAAPGEPFSQVDEYTLSARLSYALWSSLPDEELTQLAARGELRRNFRAQVQRMLADPKSKAFSENFSGQWLQSRGVLDIPINSAVVMASEVAPSDPNAPSSAVPPSAPGLPIAADAPFPRRPETGAAPESASRLPAQGSAAVEVPAATAPPAAPLAQAAPVGAAPLSSLPAALPEIPPAGRPPGVESREGFVFPPGAPGAAGRGFARRPRPVPGTVLTPEIRAAMKQETDAYFDHIVHQDCSVLELLESNYTFVNAPLATVYGIPGIMGPEMRRIELPPGSVRGGVLTMGSVLTVTSNPTRTSPVKRGKWILENILGSPPSPPPPNIPALEDSKTEGGPKAPTLRELLALHRADPKCATCHARMDPPGLAMENHNALGRLRTHEFGQPIDSVGELVTGEKFKGVSDLKHGNWWKSIRTRVLPHHHGKTSHLCPRSRGRILRRAHRGCGRRTSRPG